MGNALIKRSFDIAAAIVLLIMALPAFFVIALFMKATSPGPLLFRQKRLGLNGRVFLMNKFRKFPTAWGNKGPNVTLQNDSRMTKVGHFLERTKLDELPQLWNILIGEMSFVGPRPESLAFSHLFKDGFEQVLNYKPGIFGPNQTEYRNESGMYPEGIDPTLYYEKELFPAKAKNDLRYFKKSTFLGDIKWILHGTIVLVFSAIIWRKSMRTSLVLLCWDIGCVLIAWMFTHWFKYLFLNPAVIKPQVVDIFQFGLLAAPVLLVAVFGLTRVYRHPARFFSSTDAYRLLAANCLVWMLLAVALRLAVTSTSSLILSASCIISIAIMYIPRVAYQQVFRRLDSHKRIKQVSSRKRIAVCGVDTRSVGLCKLLEEGFEKAELVGIISDDSNHLRREIHGIEVIGLWTDLDILVARYKIEQLWIGTTLKPHILREFEMWCLEYNITLVKLDKLEGFSSLIEQEQNMSSGPSQAKTIQPEHSPSEIAV